MLLSFLQEKNFLHLFELKAESNFAWRRDLTYLIHFVLFFSTKIKLIFMLRYFKKLQTCEQTD